jgi:DNA-binding response OmpR family regulator
VAEILLVEDDDLIANGLARALGASGHRVVVAGSLAAARRVVGEASLVLCDLGLPDGDGLDLVAEIAATRPTVPVIVLTARTEEADVVAGLGSGAIDYVTKPFHLAELQARVTAQLRRAAMGEARADRVRPVLRVGDLEVDVGARTVRVGGAPIQLRPKELDLLIRLAEAEGDAVPRAVLMCDVWGEGWWGSTKTLDVHVSGLRRRLGEVPGSHSRVVTVRGVGYRLEPGG